MRISMQETTDFPAFCSIHAGGSLPAKFSTFSTVFAHMWKGNLFKTFFPFFCCGKLSILCKGFSTGPVKGESPVFSRDFLLFHFFR